MLCFVFLHYIFRCYFEVLNEGSNSSQNDSENYIGFTIYIERNTYHLLKYIVKMMNPFQKRLNSYDE